MNKIVFRTGLLIFTLSVIYFSRMDIPVEEVILRAFLVFFLITFMFGIITILFMKSITKTTELKNRDLTQPIDRKVKA